MTLEDWKAMSTASRFWFVVVMLLAVSVGAFALFTAAAPTLDPGKFFYEASPLKVASAYRLTRGCRCS